MRLLNAKKLELVNVSDSSVPAYAILSHTWGPKEVSFQDLVRLASEPLRFYVEEHQIFTKVTRAAALAVQNGYDYIWIDTCCIDKTSSAELSEAINSMFRWYEQASVCYVYLADVAPIVGEAGLMALEQSGFPESRWFTRGWTLQELIAPKDVRFYAQDWSQIGGSHKENTGFRNLLSRITGVDDRVLAGSLSPQDLSVSTRMKWAALRQTTRTEDIAYCLMGLFGVNMPLLYGEGKRAFIRLQEEILKETDDQSLFAWTSQTIEDQAGDGLSGLLAESPLAFEKVGNVRPLPPLLNRDSVPSSITNQGLRIQLYLAAVGDEDQNSPEEEYHAILDCSLRDGYREYCPTIYLRRLWGDQFARVRSQECVLLPPPADGVFIRNEGYQTVFVKQRPVYIIPEFTLPTGSTPLPLTLSGGEGYTLQGVYPPERWHSNSMSLKSVYSQLGRVMGVFRFSHSLRPNTQVDVAVGLRRVSQKQWESWCLQQRCRGNSLDHVFRSFEQRVRNRYDRSSSILHSIFFPPSLEQDDEIESQASVIETQMRGRGYITLYVVSKPEICTARELKSLSDAGIDTRGLSDTTCSRGLHPNTLAADIFAEFEDEINTLTIACSVEDAVRLSIFTGKELTSKVRVSPEALKSPSSSVEVPNWWLSSITPNELQAQNSMTGNFVSPLLQKLSTDLLYACKDGNVSQVESLIRNEEVIKWSLIEAVTKNFQSFRPIHWATIGGHLPVIHLLLSAGATRLPHTSQDMTPIHLAAIVGHLEILIYFFEDPQLSGIGIDSLLEAKTSGTLETPYHLAAAYLRPEAAESFLRALYSYGEYRQPAIGAANYIDETPLHRAAAMNNSDAIRCMLEINPRFAQEAIHLVDKYGRTPLWHAACGNSPKVIRALASHGAILDLADNFGRTPLDAACRGGATSAVDALLRLGANANCAGGPLGLTACHYAALFGHSYCLNLVAQNRADFDAGTTHLAYFRPMHLAAANGWLQCVRELCAAGSNPDTACTHYILLNADGISGRLVTRQMQSAEEIALLHGHNDIVEFLQNRKARRPTQSGSPGQLLKATDLGTLQGDPNFTPSVSDTMV